ncbi:MAG: CDGSH iron-sulfur domain-containing protein [Sporomusaceae bacterium]|jgi:CDGSH-type Zn-finger protein|nr:CDGSH iron-sulfur domain-containing protein [Sporomusaceae bacterium]
MRIKIVKNGPYLVSGGIPIREMFITPEGHHYTLQEGRILPQAEKYALCRCGASKNAPFCDGAHAKIGFDGTETASREPYRKRVADVTSGSTMDLLDDNRCAFARFCHTDRGDIWNLTVRDSDSQNREAAIKSAQECPAGRLVMVDKDGKELEEAFTPEIIIMQDPQKRVSAGIYVKGPVTIEAVDGTTYEVRNRVMLCRCGKSKNKPFCDAHHVPEAFNDGHLKRH